MSRTEDIALAFANLKGTRSKDLLATAGALQRLRSLPEYPSNDAVGRAVGVSGEIVRQFLVLLELPEPVRQLLRDGKLGLEQGRRLFQVMRARRSPSLVVDAANAMVSLTSTQSRHLAELMVRHPDFTVQDAKRDLLASETRFRQSYTIVASLGESDYAKLTHEAKKLGKSPPELVQQIVQDWLSLVG
ncbi:MAG: hypothetical protein FJ315_03235 [SAR202 cluster bacterium]|nr:hypothetical protein [SAR202 cluster bacterium]